MGFNFAEARRASAFGPIVAAIVLTCGPSAHAQTAAQQRWRAAIDAGNTSAIGAMLDSRAVEIGSLIDIENNTALHLAAERCNANVVRFLMSRGARADQANRWNDTPLRIAQVRCGMNSPTLAAFQGRMPASTAAAVNNGEWEGETSRNRVMIEARPDGIYVTPVTQHSGQTQNGFLYQSSSDGTYRLRFPDGTYSIVTVLGLDRLRLRNPDGWTDEFRLIRR